MTAHTLTTECWCQPQTAFDGHRNDDQAEPVFQASAGDPVDPAGYPCEVAE